MTTSKWHQIEGDNGSDAIGDVVLDQRYQAKFKCRHKRWPFLAWVLPKRYGSGCGSRHIAVVTSRHGHRSSPIARDIQLQDGSPAGRPPVQVSCGPAIWAGQPAKVSAACASRSGAR